MPMPKPLEDAWNKIKPYLPLLKIIMLVIAATLAFARLEAKSSAGMVEVHTWKESQEKQMKDLRIAQEDRVRELREEQGRRHTDLKEDLIHRLEDISRSQEAIRSNTEKMGDKIENITRDMSIVCDRLQGHCKQF